MAFTENDVDSIYEILKEPFEHFERTIVVSNMVQEAVARGFLKAVEEDFQFQLHSKDEEIKDLKEKLDEKDTEISEMRTLLREARLAEGSDRPALHNILGFLQAIEKKRLENEEEIMKKEREIEKLASSMFEMASILQTEMQRAAWLNSQLSEVKNQVMSKIGKISSMQHEIDNLRVDNSRLKRLARLKEHHFDEDSNHDEEERQGRFHLLTVLQERQALDISLTDKGKASSDLKTDNQEMESQVKSADERVQSLLVESDSLQEAITNQKLMQELLIICIKQQMEVYLRAYQEGNTCKPSQSNEEEAMDVINELILTTETEASFFEVVIQSWYDEMTNMLHKLISELTWKDEIILHCDQQLKSQKQAVEELGQDFAIFMSICFALLKDRNDDETREEPPNIVTHKFERKKLVELSELPISRDVPDGQEDEIINKEREIEKQASSSLVERTSILQAEMQRAACLDSHLNEVKKQDMSRIGQISSMQQILDELGVDNLRLKWLVRLKEDQFDEDVNHVKEESQQKQIRLEKVIRERQALDISLRDGIKALSDLQNDYQELESQMISADERVERLREAVDSQKLMQELLIKCIEQQLEENLKAFLEANKANEGAVKELVWMTETETIIFEVIIQTWYDEVTNMLHKQISELALKDIIIRNCDQQLENQEQAVQELGNDFATFMSICFVLLKDRNDDDTWEEPPTLLDYN